MPGPPLTHMASSLVSAMMPGIVADSGADGISY
jgi:hypothetical protein